MKTTTVIVFMMFLLTSCVERYYIDEHIENIPKLVVDGIVSNESDTQKIVLSKTSSTEDPEFLPYSACFVQVIDEEGNSFGFEESPDEPGHYYGHIAEDYLSEGSNFRLQISTPENKHYSSTFEKYSPSPSIDTVYYEIQSIPTSEPGELIDGAQFYLDFLASDDYGQKYLFRLEESFEYHSTWPIRAYIDETGFHASPADYSKFICYKTSELPQIFLLSTSNLTENTYIKYPLHFVDDHTQRLLYNYSLLIKQYSLSESAYEFWKILKENNQDEEGLFAKQPSVIKSNISNDDHPDEIALGYFGVSSVVTYRLILKTVEELSFRKVPYCKPIYPDAGLPIAPRPLYLVRMRNPKDPEGPMVWGYSGSECFDCTLLGGTVDKPPFFD